MGRKKAPVVAAAEIEKVRRHIRILVDIGRLACEPLHVDKFLDHVVIQVARAVEIDHVKILLYRRATSDFIVAAGFGWKEGVVRVATLSADLRSPAGRAFQTAEPIAVPDFNSVPGYIVPPLLKEHGIVSLANVPITVDGAAWGVLEVDSSIHCDFSSDTVEFLMAAAVIVAGALQRRDAERSEAEARATAASAEAQYSEVLLREMQHRVKNNFQIILASIALQRRRFDDPAAQRALIHIENRIQAVSLAHDQLAPRQGQVIGLAAYIRALCASISQQTEGVTIELDLDEVELSIDRAVAVGLILNEAVTNSIKHAFGEEGGRIQIALKTGIGYGEARLSVADTGPGIGPGSVPGSGLNLINLLARQIGGAITRESSSRGTTISLTFPVII